MVGENTVDSLISKKNRKKKVHTLNKLSKNAPIY